MNLINAKGKGVGGEMEVETGMEKITKVMKSIWGRNLGGVEGRT